MGRGGIGDDDKSPLPRRKCTRSLTQSLYGDRLFMLFSHTKNPPFEGSFWTFTFFHENQPKMSPESMYGETEAQWASRGGRSTLSSPSPRYGVARS